MFEGFAKVWTPVTLASRLRVGKPLALKLAGEDLVLFREKGGAAAALLDRCPHRGVRLSLGRVAPDGCLECPFHAWRFDGQGRVREVPLNPDARRERLSARALPTRELGGLVWVYTSPGETAPGEPVVPEALLLPGVALTYLEVEWDAHWTRAMENMLDSPHVPYVHAATIGRFVRPRLKPGSTMHISWEDTPQGGLARSWLDGEAEATAATLEFLRPNIMVLRIPMPGRVFRMHAVCVPVAERRVRMIIVGARSFARSRLLNPLFNYSNRRIAREDQAVVESSFPVEVPPPSLERSVRTDRATLRFRRYYFEVLKPSSVGPDPGIEPMDLTGG